MIPIEEWSVAAPSKKVERFLEREAFPAVAEAAASTVLADIRKRGDKAVAAAVAKYEGNRNLKPSGFRIPDAELAKYNGELAGIWWKRGRYEQLNSSLLDYLPGVSLVFEELSTLAENASRLNQAYDTAFEELCTTAQDVEPSTKIWWRFGEISATFPGHASMDVTHVEADASNWYSVKSRPQDFASAGTEEVAKKIEDFYAGGGQVYVVAPTPGALARLKHVFTGLPVEDYFVGNLSEGFWLDDDKVAFLTETRIFNRHATKSRKRQIAGSVTAALMVESLNRGDYVAHEDHGVGRYLGLVRVEVNGGLVDCALLEYEGGDRLKFPVSDLQKIERLEPSSTASAARLGKTSRSASSRRWCRLRATSWNFMRSVNWWTDLLSRPMARCRRNSRTHSSTTRLPTR